MPTEDAYSSGHLVLSHLGFEMFFCWDHWHSIKHCTTNSWLLTWFDFLLNLTSFLDLTPPFHVPLVVLLAKFDMTEYMFSLGICNGCGMLTGDAYSSGNLVLSRFGCSSVEPNLAWTCLVSGLLRFEHPSVILFFASIMYNLHKNGDLDITIIRQCWWF